MQPLPRYINVQIETTVDNVRQYLTQHPDVTTWAVQIDQWLSCDQDGNDDRSGREPDGCAGGIMLTQDCDDILTAVRYTLHNIMHEIQSGRKILWQHVNVWGHHAPHIPEWRLSGPVRDCITDEWVHVEPYRPATPPENWWLCTGPDWSHMRRR